MSSNGTLSKSQDYKQMMVANGSIDSMDKSVLSSEAGSFEGYDQKPHYNEYVNQNALRPAAQDHQQPHKVATISKGSAHRARAAAAALEPDAFELSYRNEGFRDNSTYGGGTRANSISTSVAEDTPIIHQTDAEAEELGSDYYGNASTLPLRTDTGSSSVGGRRGQPGLAFLSELKQNLPEYQRSSHSSFLPQRSSGDSLPFDQKLDQFNFSTESSLYRPAPAVPQQASPADMRRPDSYYTAVRSSKAPTSHYRTPRPLAQPPAAPTVHASRPKTVYQTAAQEASPTTPTSPRSPRSPTALATANPYHRSKSEALLETDFDSEAGEGGLVPLHANGRSHSQPLETAM